MDGLIRGGIYLARLDPSKGAEIGKLRPVVLLTDQSLLKVDPPLLFVCPLSIRSDPAFAPLHVALPARDNLKVQSYALTEHCRGISRRRIVDECLGSLADSELHEILQRLNRLVGL